MEAGRALRLLDRLAALLYSLVDEYFGGDGRLRAYVARRVEAARELLRREWRLRVLRMVGYRSYRAVFASSAYAEARPPRRIAVKTLDGGVAVVETGTPVEQLLHFTEVSPWMLRCSCPDAVYAAAAADRAAVRQGVVRLPVFHRYSLCKHVLALIAVLAAKGLISLDDPWLRRSLVKALAGAYARIHGRLPDRVKPLLRGEDRVYLVN